MDTPLLALDRWLSILRYGRGVVFLAPSAASVQADLRKLRKYGVKTYAYRLRTNGVREYRVRSAQADWARAVLAGRAKRAWSDTKPGAAARPVGFSGVVLALYERIRRK